MYGEDEITGHGIPYTGTGNPYTGSQFRFQDEDPWGNPYNVNTKWPTIDYNEMDPGPSRYTDEMGRDITYEEWMKTQGFMGEFRTPRKPFELGEWLGKHRTPDYGQVDPRVGAQGQPSPTFGQNIKNFAGGLLDYIPKPLPHKPMPMYSGGELVENLQGPPITNKQDLMGSDY